MAGRESLKRRFEEQPGGPSAKKTKSQEDAEKARTMAEILAKTKEIAAQMAARNKQGVTPASASPSLPAVPSASASAAAAARMEEIKARLQNTLAANPSLLSTPLPGDRTKRGLKMEYHPALMMDGSGQLNIHGGAKALVPKPDFATVRANQRAAAPSTEVIKKELKIEAPSADLSDPTKNPYFDPSLGAGTGGPRERVKKGLKFVQPGRYINEANQLRAKAQLEKLKRDIAESVKKTGMAVELDLVADQSMRTEPPPAVEWWDAILVPDGYDNFDADSVLYTESSLVTHLVQHPVPIQPPAEGAEPKPRPVMLTLKEAKKLRRQRRLEAHKEKREKIRLGLLPPEQQRVKMSNLMVVLGKEAVQDPTKMEAMVKAQAAARKQKHKDLVASKKLTDEQRKEKKRQKLLEDTSNLVDVAVFRINDLSHPQHKYKVNINAEQHNLTGTAILYSGMSIVIVEGGPKGVKAYKKLMLKRIDWSLSDDVADEGETSEGPPKPKNECALVWEGNVKERSFKFFRFKNMPTEQRAKEFLEKLKALHYWDAARNYIAPGV
ncbi:hypothetical protein HDU86_002688 [Geranomyces michiganensis]|nr:hypothetical protein HDU86_002688 [Geranomyces michiganensis]